MTIKVFCRSQSKVDIKTLLFYLFLGLQVLSPPNNLLIKKNNSVEVSHCVNSVCIRSCSGPYFSAFGLNTERYSVSLSIQSECEKMRTRIIPNTDILHGVFYFLHLLHFLFWMLNSGIWVFPKSLFRKKFNTSSLEEMFLWNSRKTFIFPRKPEGILHHNFLTTSLNYDTIK